MTVEARDLRPAAERRRGWLDAGGFVVALTALNIAYGLAHALGADPVAFITLAMLISAGALLLITGLGDDWRDIVRHPLSWLVGAGIIGMEAAYFMLLRYLTPAEGSVFIRLNLPVSILAGWLMFGRRASRVSLFGVGLMCLAIAYYVTTVPAHSVGMAIVLGLACAFISVTRNFAAEFHPWNRKAHDVREKMRVTGLVLIVTSIAGAAVVAMLMGLVGAGALPPTRGIPAPSAFLHAPTILIAAVMGLFVLTAMQYFSFSAVVRIGTERFIAAGALVPVTTLLVQHAAAAFALLPAAVVDLQFIVIMLAVIVSVFIYIGGGRHPR